MFVEEKNETEQYPYLNAQCLLNLDTCNKPTDFLLVPESQLYDGAIWSQCDKETIY